MAKFVARYEVQENGDWVGTCPEVTHFRVKAPTLDEVKQELCILIRALAGNDAIIQDRVL